MTCTLYGEYFILSHNILFGKLKDYHVAGQKVTFETEPDPKDSGKLRAVNVVPVA